MLKIGLAIVALGLLGGSARGELLAQVQLNGLWQGGAYSDDNTQRSMESPDAGHCTSPRGPSYAEPLQAFLRGTEEELPEVAAKMARSN